VTFKKRHSLRLLGLLVAALTICIGLALPASASTLIAPSLGAQVRQSPANGASLSAVAFSDATHGWAVGSWLDASYASVPVLLATSDRGATWSARDLSMAGSGASLSSISFVDAMHGWAVGSSYDQTAGFSPFVLATGDGGATWNVQSIDTPSGGAWLSSVAFANAEHGWAVGTCDAGWIDGMPAVAPFIVATDDGGLTWYQQDPGYVDLLDGMASLNSVNFVDAQHGWAVGSTGCAANETAIILATSDGGATWAIQQSSSRDGYGGLYSVSFVDPLHGWAVGGAGGEQNGSPVLIGTSDGGATWSNESPPAVATNSFLDSVRFIDAGHGWAVGTRNRGYVGNNPVYVPVILATSDGGHTWLAQDAGSAGTTGGLGSVAFIDAANGWAVGASGAIVATANGGATWTRQHGAIQPQITGLKPARARRAATVTITGTGFGAKRGNAIVKFGSTKCTRYVSWSATRITCKVPAKARLGKLKIAVVTTAGTSNTRTFTVRR
jgi:photosystem II stability/assembly factor-like uncharacterized protein